MISLTAMTRIYLYRGACDMRKSFDGLCGIIRSELEMDPLSGSLFVFVNGNRKMVKLLYWDQDGLALWCKRLEEGKFLVPDKSGSIDPKNSSCDTCKSDRSLKYKGNDGNLSEEGFTKWVS